MDSIIDVLVGIARTPAFLVALIALIGLLLQRKSASDTVKGTLKTFVGFLVLTAGAGVVETSLTPFGGMFEAGFNVQGVVPNNEAIVAIAIQQYGTLTALVMFFGMLVNILIAAFTRFKHVFLTGHHTFYMAVMLAVIFKVVGFSDVTLVIAGALALGAIMSLSPFFLQKYMRTMTGNDTVGLGHFGGGGYWLAGAIGNALRGNREKVTSTEDVNFPKGLGFLRDSTVAIALTMMVVYLIVAISAGPGYAESYANETGSEVGNFIVWAITLAGQFAAGVYIILAGVRLILAEIVPAFKGISERLVPNAIPALDCPIVYPFAPNAVLIGFLSSFVGGIVAMPFMVWFGLPIVIPGVVPHFFCGATAGVFGNSRGGLRGAILGAFAQGIAISFLPLALMPVLGSLGFANTTFSDFDFTVYGSYFGMLGGGLGQLGVWLGLGVVYLGIAAYSLLNRAPRPTSVESA